MIHILLHFLVPAGFAAAFFRNRFLHAWLVMSATVIVDLDHLLATPIYDPNRCSIGFHPLHSYGAILAYAGVAVWPRSRLIGVGLLIHMALDFGDCLLMH